MHSKVEIPNYYKPIAHFLVWGIVIQLLFDISGLYYSFYDIFVERKSYFDEAFLLLPLLICLFYWNSLFLIPRYLKKQTWWKYLLSLVVSFLVIIQLGQLFYKLLRAYDYNLRIDEMDISDQLLMMGFMVIAISFSLAIFKMAVENASQKKEAQEKQKEAEMKFLTAQVNPHFLYNTLNSIYALATIEDAPQTTEAILRLAEIMRYPLNEGTKKVVYLSQEIKFLEDYIELQKIRIGEEYPVSFKVECDRDNIKIPPLLFISFVENAFKYGVSQQNSRPIRFSILLKNNELRFVGSNEIVKLENVKSHKLGLRNVKERLELTFPDNYVLKVKEEERLFFVDLLININHN